MKVIMITVGGELNLVRFTPFSISLNNITLYLLNHSCNKMKCVKNLCYALLSPQYFNGKIMYSLMCTLEVELKIGNINWLHAVIEIKYTVYPG